MDFQKSLSIVELLLVAFFIIFYILYFLRVFNIKSIQKKRSSIYGKTVLRAVYFLLLIIALLAPSFGEHEKAKVKAVGKDIFILIDLSKSMNANDIKPSRLEKVKYEIKNIIANFSSDRIGLIIFSSDAYLQSPLTYDRNALTMFTETLRTGIVSSAGTSFSAPLQMALEKFSKKAEDMVTKQQFKVMILFSDGEDFDEDTSTTIKEIEDAGIKLFTVGVGTKEGSKIPQGRGFQRDRNGQDVITKLNTVSLKAIAEETKGKYYEISMQKNQIPLLINDIKNIKGEVRSEVTVNVNENKYIYFLFAAFVLILLDILFPFKQFKYS